MDFKKLYTPTEAAALYNVAKIEYDPTAYSLRGNLITGMTLSESRYEHISNFDYTAERKLTHLLKTKESRDIETLTGISDTKEEREGWSNALAYFLIQQDNLYVNLDLIQKFVPLEHLKTTKIMETLVTMCVALNSSKSCAKDMLWLALSGYDTAHYADVHVFKRLKTQLETGGVIDVFTEFSSIDPRFVPSYDRLELAKTKPFNGGDLDTKADTLYSYVINAFEVMWAYKHLPKKYKDCFETLCYSQEVVKEFDCELFKKFTIGRDGIVIDPVLDEAISMNDPELRYAAYQEIIKSSGDYKSILHYVKTELGKKHFLNPVIASFVSFIAQISLANIRINTLRILHEYCITKKYLSECEVKDAEEWESEDDSTLSESELFSKFKGFEESSKSKSLVDFETRSYSKGKSAAIDEDHRSDAMFEALDKIRATFKSDRYTFDVEDVVDTSDAYKAKYDAIVSKVDLVNKLLIRRIKDIKTYNTGGKNTGIPSGRIDRKTMYRYKYDPNIFYNNTYKTLESDLAFGIVLDESGSMYGKGIDNGRITMVVLHETLKALGINHSIIGHTSYGDYKSTITRYQAFREDKTYKVCKNYALVAAEAKSGNCDSGALYYMEKAFERVRNKDKICLIFSDGAPTECTGSDLKAQVRKMERKGIKVIGIGINFANIAKYYNDYANGRNLKDMLDIVSNILEQYVLKKKDK